MEFLYMFEPAIVMGTLLGLAFGVKLLVWGRGPIRRRRLDDPNLEQRVAELEDRHQQQFSDFAGDVTERLAELEERLDFTERLLTQQRLQQQQALPGHEESTPI